MDNTGFVLKNVISDQITSSDMIASTTPRRRSAHGRIRQYVYHSKIRRNNGCYIGESELFFHSRTII